ncbi:hypothetical protein RHMOL_Rhmol05G0118700 [Rhododendron molle]|uniref:Uncharacterized protein n=1 Tax=Rhododendron molle TaxID=49168 RepID=A0ACC0NN80_RHOML|nr:hypothetical protein RHMOL_Rhmol05G0118700 [Rhododendron molle]
MIRRTNPGSTALLKVERTLLNTTPVFQRMFVVYEAQARGFVNGCRPIIGLDVCHLKGPFLGQLMHAVGRNANDQMFPIAIAVVEAKLKDSWVWFLENLLQVIERSEEHGWTFISDRQKGLVESFKQLMPGADHRFCVRHIYANLKDIYKDDSQWVHVELDAITAPPLRRPPGRPKKARRKASDEPKNAHLVRRTHQSLRSSKCQQYGHNTRTCKGALVSSGITIATSMPTNGMTSVLSCVGPNDKGKGIAIGDLVPCFGMGSGRGSGRGSSRGGTGRGSSRGTGRGVNSTAAQMQMRSTTFREVYFSRGVGNSATIAIMDKFHPSQGSSNMPQVNNSNYGSLEGYAPF